MDKEREALARGELWSWLKKVMEQGAAIHQDYQSGKHPTYEHYSARMDAAASERADELAALTAQQEPSGVREGMLRAAEICSRLDLDFQDGKCDPSPSDCAEAITRAAEAINAEGHTRIPVYLDQCAPSATTPQPASTWDAHGNSGMRYPEESDVSGGATDCDTQPADKFVSQGEHNGGDYDMRHSAPAPQQNCGRCPGDRFGHEYDCQAPNCLPQSAEGVVVPAYIVDRAVMLLETAADHGVQARWIDGKPTPNSEMCRDTAALLAAAKEPR